MSRSRLESSRTSRSRLGWWSQRLGLELLRLVPIPVTATNFRSILFGHGASSTIYGTGAAAATRARLAVFEWLRRQPGRQWHKEKRCGSDASACAAVAAAAAVVLSRWRRCAGRGEFYGAHLLQWAAGLIVDARLVTGQRASSSTASNIGWTDARLFSATCAETDCNHHCVMIREIVRFLV